MNTGFDSRATLIAGSQLCTLQGMLTIGPLLQKRLLLDKVDIVIKLYRNTPQISLIGNADDDKAYQIHIQNAYMQVRKIRPLPQEYVALENRLAHSAAVYPFTHYEFTYYPVAVNSTNFAMDLYEGRTLPNKLYIFQLDVAAFNGKYKYDFLI